MNEWKIWGRRTALAAPTGPGVYIFRLAGGKTIQRLKGESGIVYIGCASNIGSRLKNHLRAMNVERNVAYNLRRAQEEVGHLEVSYMPYPTHTNAKRAERILLAQFEAAHIEFPPLNRSEPGKKLRMVEEWLKLKPGSAEELKEALSAAKPADMQTIRPTIIIEEGT